MLAKMYLTNFLSFLERTEFNFTSSKYTILSETNVSDKGILKGALMIGANASGKSNALSGLKFIIELMKGDGVLFEQLRCYYTQTPIMSAEYEFVFSGQPVRYVISYNVQTKNLSEYLTINEKEVLNRAGNRGRLNIGDTEVIDDKLDAKTSFLRTASFNTGRFPQEPILRELMDYLLNSNYIDGYNQSALLGKSIMNYAEKYGVDNLNNYLKDFNYDFYIEYGNESSGEGLNIRLESGKKSVFFKRKSFPIPSAFYTESQGNQVFADMLPQIIEVIEKPGMLIIDEFGNSLHNKLAEKIVRFFMEKSKHSQLYITSHDTNLISNYVVRPDQINLITFENAQGSKVKRISTFKPREAQNLEKMYLGGMFEGLPKYDEEI